MDILKQIEAGVEADLKFTAEAAERYALALSEWKTVRRQLVDACIVLRQSPLTYSDRLVSTLESKCKELDAAIFECRYPDAVLTESDHTATFKDIIRKVEKLKEHVVDVVGVSGQFPALGLNTGITVLYTQDQYVAPSEGMKLVAKLAK